MVNIKKIVLVALLSVTTAITYAQERVISLQESPVKNYNIAKAI